MNTVAKTQLKEITDILLPSAAAFLVFRYAKKETGNLKESIIYAVLSFVLAYVITQKATTSMTTEIKTVNVKDLNPNGTPGSGTIGDAQGFDGGPLAVRLRADIYSWGTRDKDLYKQIANLSDAELMQVYNAYNKLFKAQDKEGMITAMSSENYGNNWLDSVAANANAIIARLRKYGVSD